jgi:hypothetical protein
MGQPSVLFLVPAVPPKLVPVSVCQSCDWLPYEMCNK